MRVLLVTHRFPPEFVGGVERYVQALAGELRARGDEVAIVTRVPEPERSVIERTRERLADGTAVHRLRGGVVRLDNFLVDHARLEGLFAQVLVEASPDVVHVNHLIGLSPRSVELARRLGVPVVVSLHDFYFACPLAHLQKVSGELCAGPDAGRECARTCFASEGPVASVRWGARAAYFRRLLAIADRVVCPPGHLAGFFESFAPASLRMRLLPLGVGVPRHAVPATANGVLRLAYVGVVVRHKGVHLIVEALDAARLGPVELRVLGRVEERAYADALRAAAARVPGLELRLTGEFRPAELPYLLGGVDAVVLPSQVPEAFPLAPREALALGVPPVVARLGGLPEAIDEGVNGLAFDAGSAAGLAGALRRLAWEPGLRERLREGAAATAVPTAGQHADALRAIYEEAIAESRARPAEPSGDAAEREHLFETMVDAGLAARAPR